MISKLVFFQHLKSLTVFVEVYFMNDSNQICPQCNSLYGYPDQHLWICPECSHEWSIQKSQIKNEASKFLDANGVSLSNGDTVKVVKDLKIGKGTLKSGTKIRNIKLLDDPVNGHDIACKLDGYGAIYLKCSVVKK